MAEHWMIDGGKLRMSPKLKDALAVALGGSIAVALSNVSFRNTYIVIEDRATVAALKIELSAELPALIARWERDGNRLAKSATLLLAALSGTAPAPKHASTRPLVECGDATLVGWNDDEDGWPEARGLTLTELRDPEMVMTILATIAKAEGSDLASACTSEYRGSLPTMANAYGLRLPEWYTLADNPIMPLPPTIAC